MPLGTEVDLGPGHIVLDGVPAPHKRGTAAPLLLGPCLLWPRSPISATAALLLLVTVIVVVISLEHFRGDGSLVCILVCTGLYFCFENSV